MAHASERTNNMHPLSWGHKRKRSESSICCLISWFMFQRLDVLVAYFNEVYGIYFRRAGCNLDISKCAIGCPFCFVSVLFPTNVISDAQFLSCEELLNVLLFFFCDLNNNLVLCFV